jgi:hypothetical protein
MSFVAVAIGGAGLASAGIGYLGAQKAAGAQANAANNALQFQEAVYNQNQANLKPFINTGQGATYTLGQLTGQNGNAPNFSSFFTDPSYQFALQQGTRGTINAANAQGIGLSGGTLKDLSEFNQGLASQQYGNYYNRLLGLSQLGANAAGGFATTSTNAAGQIGNTIQGLGQAQASGFVGGANAIMSHPRYSIPGQTVASLFAPISTRLGSSRRSRLLRIMPRSHYVARPCVRMDRLTRQRLSHGPSNMMLL